MLSGILDESLFDTVRHLHLYTEAGLRLETACHILRCNLLHLVPPLIQPLSQAEVVPRGGSSRKRRVHTIIDAMDHGIVHFVFCLL